MPKQSKFSTTITIELLFIMENIWNYGEKFSEREREKERESNQHTINSIQAKLYKIYTNQLECIHLISILSFYVKHIYS